MVLTLDEIIEKLKNDKRFSDEKYCEAVVKTLFGASYDVFGRYRVKRYATVIKNIIENTKNNPCPNSITVSPIRNRKHRVSRIAGFENNKPTDSICYMMSCGNAHHNCLMRCLYLIVTAEEVLFEL